jgi:7,8-dihydroneopterin aldolase/epimerase/oxygenase
MCRLSIRLPGSVRRKITPAVPQTPDRLILEVHDLEVDVLTGVYSEETHLPQPLRISIKADLAMADHYAPDTPLSASKSYMDLKWAATDGLPKDVHFTLIEAVGEHIAGTIFLQDDKVSRVEIRIVKLAIAQAGERIGITMVRNRPVRDARG